MTSKEALKDLLSGEIISLSSYMDLRLGIIEQDLEVLEILRKYVRYDDENHVIRMKPFVKSVCNFDYEEVKEWLEQ